LWTVDPPLVHRPVTGFSADLSPPPAVASQFENIPACETLPKKAAEWAGDILTMQDMKREAKRAHVDRFLNDMEAGLNDIRNEAEWKALMSTYVLIDWPA
jgi:hypothetical protein